MANRILIVDDDPDVILFLSTLLRDNGYATDEARNGVEALERIHETRPDLILLDLMMPQKSGIALLSDLQQEEELRNIPIIMVTGVAGETGIDLDAFLKRIEASSDAPGPPRITEYLEKPVDPDRLLKCVRETLN
ncbi:MAG: response regulator [Desulfobacteraceae bacterium]|jgi:CheY-like chemotaxis protein